jgi:broad specificity phosphatase PhoE
LTDCGLTSTGRNQAKQIPNLLGDVSIDLVLSSPLTRALNTAVLDCPNHDILVHYELRELGSRIPENNPRPMKNVFKTLQADIEDHASFGVNIDINSLQPANWPNPPHSTISKRDRLHMAFEWLYKERTERTIAVVCHYNVIRAMLQDRLGRTNIRPQNADPIRCLLTPEGDLVVAEQK